MEFPPKLRPKKGWKQQPEEAPFPVPIQSLTSKPVSNSRWFYYSAQLVNGSVIVKSDGDSHFLYKMGFFGKGMFSRGKPEHARMMSSFQGVKRKSLPASERRFQQERFQKVRQHRYEQHLSWKKMKDAESKAKAEKEETSMKEESEVSTVKREEEHLFGVENIPSTSSVPNPVSYAKTSSSEKFLKEHKSPPRCLEENFPPYSSDSSSDSSSLRSWEGGPRVPPHGSPPEEENVDLQQTFEKNFEKESLLLGQWEDLAQMERQEDSIPDTVEENVKKKEKTWLTDTSDWNVTSETENVKMKGKEKVSAGTDFTDKEAVMAGEDAKSIGTLDLEGRKTVKESTIVEKGEVEGQVMEKLRGDSDKVALGYEIESDSRRVPKRKSGREEEEASSDSITKKRKMSDQGEELSGIADESEPKVKLSQNWPVNEKEWEITGQDIANVDAAAGESEDKREVKVSEPETEEGKEAKLEKEEDLQAVNVDEVSGREQDESTNDSIYLPGRRDTSFLQEASRRSNQEGNDEGEEADTEEDVVREEEGDKKSQSKKIKGDSLEHSSKKKTLVRKPDPYPVREFLQLSYEEAFFLSYGLGCLSLYNYSPSISKGKPFDLCGMWLEFLTLKPRFVATYACYHYYRSKGWVPRCGIKYGCDFVVYRKGPNFYHSSFAVLAQLTSDDSANVTALSSWSRFLGFSRMVENAAKDVVLCFISCPEGLNTLDLRSPACIPHLEVQEIWVKRWCPTRGRTGKDFPSLIS